MKPIIFDIPEGATQVKITWDADNDRPVAQFKKGKKESDDGGTSSSKSKSGSGGGSPSTWDHVRSFITGEGPGAFGDNPVPPKSGNDED